jgi:hypothetical protein
MLWVFGIPNLLSFCEVLVEEDRLSLEDCLLRKFMLMRIAVLQGLVNFRFEKQKSIATESSIVFVSLSDITLWDFGIPALSAFLELLVEAA